MRLLTKNFYKFLFGFIGIVILSLAIISIAGSVNNDSETTNPQTNTAGE